MTKSFAKKSSQGKEAFCWSCSDGHVTDGRLVVPFTVAANNGQHFCGIREKRTRMDFSCTVAV